MRYEAPHCPWCPDSIRAWREGQPYGQLYSVGDPSPRLAILHQPALGTHSASPPIYDECLSARIADIVGFAQRQGYRKIGIATCGGAEAVVEVLSTRLVHAGFQAILAAGSELAAFESEPLLPSLALASAAEPRCNPAAQARLLNAEACDMNVVAGLCVGCDSIFFRHAEAPTTALCCGSSQTVISEKPAADCGA